jgi:hypothetical protein
MTADALDFDGEQQIARETAHLPGNSVAEL